MWDQGEFEPGSIVLTKLEEVSQKYDFAIFIFSFDDSTEIRGEKLATVRDNVLFELGLFIGQSSTERCFIIKPRSKKDQHIAIDLAGLVTLDFDDSNDNLISSLSPACYTIRNHINKLGVKKATSFIKTKDGVQRFIDDVLEVIVRAVSIPNPPDLSDLRAFLFKQENNELVCRGSWALHPVDEPRGKLKFIISKEWASRVSIVRTVIEKDFTFEEINQKEQLELASEKEVSEKIIYVISAPIFNSDGTVWGIVDLDTSIEEGKTLLTSRYAKTAILKFASHFEKLIPIMGA